MALYIPQFKVILYHKNEGGGRTWNFANPIDIPDVQEIDIRIGIEGKQDTFRLKIANTWKYNTSTGQFYNHYGTTAEDDGDKGVNIIIDDRIRIFAWNGLEEASYPANSTEISESFLFDGTITQFNYEVDANGKKSYLVQGANTTERLLKNYFPSFHRITDTVNRSDLIIKALLDLVSDSPEYNIIWDTANNDVATNTLDYSSKYRPVYQQIEELSKGENTGIGDCYFYIDTRESGGTYQNYFVWKKREFPNTFTDAQKMKEGEGIESMKIVHGTWDVVNSVMVDAGKDPRGHQVRVYYSDPWSYARLGGKWKPLAINTASTIMTNEMNVNSGQFGHTDNFPTSYTPAYEADLDAATSGMIIGGITYNKGDTILINSDEEYTQFVREQAKVFARREGNRFVNQFKYPRYKFTTRYGYGNINFVPAQVVKCISHSFGWTGDGTSDDKTQRLRLIEYRHLLNKNGWKTEFQLEQDWGLAST